MPQMPQRLDLTAEQTLEEKFMTELAVIDEKISNLVKHVDSLTEEIRNLRTIHQSRVEDHEKRLVLLEERTNRLNWIVNMIAGVVLTGIAGGILSLIIKT